MTEYDAPLLPDRDRQIGGSLADHVRQYATDDPQEIATRDRLAELADGVAPAAQQPPAGPDGPFATTTTVPVPPAADSPAEVHAAPQDELVWQTWDDVPDGTEQIRVNDGRSFQHAGGLWTEIGGKQQFPHGYLVHNLGPFGPVSPGS
jgi:hypothetical protein